MSHHTPAYKGRSQAFGAAMSRSAERRRCPKCNRKSALIRLSIEDDPIVATYCRWDDCDYARLREGWGGSPADDLQGFRRGGGRGVDGPTRNDPPQTNDTFDSSALAWVRLCQKAAALAGAWADFKLALDDYGLMCHGSPADTKEGV